MHSQLWKSAYLLCVIAGKSTIAQQLASRINVPNVMQTDVIYEVSNLKLSKRPQPTLPLRFTVVVVNSPVPESRNCL